jgi:hypothetical protein
MTPRALIDQRPLGMLQVRVLALCFLVALFDGFDTQAIAYTGPAMLADFALAPTALAPVLTAGIIGMALGAMLLGSWQTALAAGRWYWGQWCCSAWPPSPRPGPGTSTR